MPSEKEAIALKRSSFAVYAALFGTRHYGEASGTFIWVKQSAP